MSKNEILLARDGRLRPVIKILTDYTRDDLAHDEVQQALVTACVKHGVDATHIDVGAIPGLDTVVAGFKSAQLLLNSQLGYGHVFHTNCAPRKNIVSVKSSGEKIVLGMTKNGGVLLAVNSGYSLAPFAEAVVSGFMQFYQTSVPDSGSQFRSRDFFPEAVADLAAHLTKQYKKLGPTKISAALKKGKYEEILKGLSFIGKPVAPSALPYLPPATVCYVDNFGNIKLNSHHDRLLAQYLPGTQMVIAIGNTVSDVTVGGAGFSQGEGVIALTGGSSGWNLDGKGTKALTEIFLRGGRAESHFPGLKTGDQVLGIRKKDLLRVIEALRDADRRMSDDMDLYNISEARILRVLSWAKLIRDGFDTSELQKVLDRGGLLKRLAASREAGQAA